MDVTGSHEKTKKTPRITETQQRHNGEITDMKTSAYTSFILSPSLLYMALHLEHNQPERQVMEQFQFDASCLFPFTPQ